MLRTSSIVVLTALITQMSFPAVANAEQMRSLAIAQMDPSQKLKIAVAGERLAAKVASFSPKKREKWMRRLGTLIARAEDRADRLSDEQFAQKLEVMTSPATPNSAGPLPEDAAAVVEVLNDSVSVDIAESERSSREQIENVDRVLAAVQGTTAKSRFLSLTAEMKASLAAQTASVHVNGNLLLILMLGGPILVGLAVGLTVGSLWIFLIAGLVASFVVFVLLVNAISRATRG